MKPSSTPFCYFSKALLALPIAFCLVHIPYSKANTMVDSLYSQWFEHDDNGCNVYTELHNYITNQLYFGVSELGASFALDMFLSFYFGAANLNDKRVGRPMMYFTLQTTIKMTAFVRQNGFGWIGLTDLDTASKEAIVAGTMFAVDMSREILLNRGYDPQLSHLSMNGRYALSTKSIGITSPLSDTIKTKLSERMVESGIDKKHAAARSSLMTVALYSSALFIGTKTNFFQADYLDSLDLSDKENINLKTRSSGYQRVDIPNGISTSLAYKLHSTVADLCHVYFDETFPSYEMLLSESAKAHYCSGLASVALILIAPAAIGYSSPKTFPYTVAANMADAGGLFAADFVTNEFKSFFEHPLTRDAAGVAADTLTLSSLYGLRALVKAFQGPTLDNIVNGAGVVTFFDVTKAVFSHLVSTAWLTSKIVTGEADELSARFCPSRG